MNSAGPNRRLIYFIVIPLAIYLGWILSEPMSQGTLLTVGLLFGLFCVPILLRWHRPMLFFTWNAALIAFFLPGRPPMWMAIAAAAFMIVFLQWIIEKKTPLVTVRSVNWTLGLLLVILVITAYVRGGIGVKALGSEVYGGRRYIFIFAAIVGFYALSTLAVPPERAGRYVGYYFLGGFTNIISNLVALGGPSLYWVYMFFPYESALFQIEASTLGMDLVRLGGVALAATSLYLYLLARFPIRDMFSLQRPWLLPLVMVSGGLTMLGGFRAGFVFVIVVFALKFILDGLLWTRLFFALVLFGVGFFSLLLPLAYKLPLSVQRTLSFIPGANVDPLVVMDAFASTDWRLQMWSVLLDDLPKYLLVGKGYVINPTDMYLAEEAMNRGFVTNYEWAIISGDYHSGPLSVLMNFGIAGALAWLAFCLVSLRVLIRNFRYGEPRWRNLNGLLLSYFITKVVFFFFVFGDFATELYMFTGTLGLSIAVNNGMRAKKRTPRPVVKVPTLDVRRFEQEPALARDAS